MTTVFKLQKAKPFVMLLILLCMSAALWAVPAKPGLKRVLTLTDGTTITAQLVGDEHGHFWLGQDGRAYQAVSGSDVFQLIDKTEVTKRAQTRRAAAKVIAASTSDGLGKYGQSGLGAFNSIGEYTIPVIMVQFSNKQFLPTTTVEKMTRFYNEEGYHDEEGCVGSVRDYFKSQSRGMFVPTFDVVGIVTLNHEYAYYGAGDESVSKVKEFASDAVKAAISQLSTDFSQYVRTTTNVNGSTTGVPLVCIFYAGYGQATGSMDDDDDEEDTVWPCEVDWNTSVQGTMFNSFFVGNELYYDGKLMGMGVFCHETGHALGLPDFYCTDYSYNQDDPFGNWSIMDCGAYVNDARAPIGYTAYERSYLGWLDIPTYTAGSNKTLDPYTTEDGTTAVKVATNNSTEYFILENRQPGTWYPESMGSGLMVSRFAYSNTYWSYNTLNNTQRSKRAMIVTADGTKLYYSGDQNNLYGNGVNSITSLKRYSSGTINPQINTITKNADGTITLNAAVAPPDPLIVADESLMFETAVGIPQTLTFDILSEGLTEDISASLNDENNVFSLDKTTISRAESEDGVSVSVTFTPVSAGNYTGTITLASAGADDVTVSLSATATLPVPDSNRYELVTDASTLETGDKVLIAYINGDTKQVMSTTQNSNNRPATTEVTLNDDYTLTPGEDAQVITLEKDGSNFLFNVGDGYLYAASSTKNYLRTESAANDNAKATISIQDGNATITFQGTNTRNTMRYNPNNNSPIFSCYASNSTTGSLPQIYRQKKVEPVTVSIGTTGYATLYYSDKNLVVPEGVEAYTYTITDGKLEESWLYEADEVIPQGTAVILKDLVTLEEGETSHDYAFTVTTAEGDVDDDNLLMGFNEDAETVGPDGATEGYKFYMLSLDKNSTPGSVGFYYGKKGGTAFTSKAHKAYLPVPDTAAHGKSFFLFSEAETATTDINNVQSSKLNAQSAEIYDLSGRKIVGGKLQPGIYIMNGRKIVVK